MTQKTTDHKPAQHWNPLTQMYAQERERVVYCIPAAGVKSSAYQGLVKALENEISMRVFEAKGFDRRLAPHQNLTGLIADYVDIIIRQKPGAPLFLVGHSFGGSISFEMARDLEKRGMEVHLITLDCNLYPHREDNALKEIKRCKRLQSASTDKVFQDAMNVYLAQLNIYKSYSPSGVFNGDISVLYAKEGIIVKEAPLDFREIYRPYCGKDIFLDAIDGGHLTLLSSNNVHSVAEKIITIVRQATA